MANRLRINIRTPIIHRVISTSGGGGGAGSTHIATQYTYVNASYIGWFNRHTGSVGTLPAINSSAYAICWYNGKLHIGGNFTMADGKTVNRIAYYSGGTWWSCGTGTNGLIIHMAVANGKLFVGGSFTQAGGLTVNRIARWNGAAWASCRQGVGSDVYRIYPQGSTVYIGGLFTGTSTLSSKFILRWIDTVGQWSAVGHGVTGQTGPVYSMLWKGSRLWIAGNFTKQLSAGTSVNMGAWIVVRDVIGNKWSATNFAVLYSGTQGYLCSAGPSTIVVLGRPGSAPGLWWLNRWDYGTGWQSIVSSNPFYSASNRNGRDILPISGGVLCLMDLSHCGPYGFPKAIFYDGVSVYPAAFGANNGIFGMTWSANYDSAKIYFVGRFTRIFQKVA